MSFLPETLLGGVFIYAQDHFKEGANQYLSMYFTDILGSKQPLRSEEWNFKQSYNSEKGLNKGACGAHISNILKNLSYAIFLQ